VSKLLGIVGSVVGSYAGWYAGRPIGLMSAFTFSMVGTGAGIWFGRHMASRLLD
jgi:hypothetical protein